MKPLILRPVPPMRKHRGAKRKSLLAEFDPLLSKKDRAEPLRFVLHKEFANNMRDFRAVVPEGHELERNPLALLSGISQNIMEQIPGK